MSHCAIAMQAIKLQFNAGEGGCFPIHGEFLFCVVCLSKTSIYAAHKCYGFDVWLSPTKLSQQVLQGPHCQASVACIYLVFSSSSHGHEAVDLINPHRFGACHVSIACHDHHVGLLTAFGLYVVCVCAAQLTPMPAWMGGG